VKNKNIPVVSIVGRPNVGKSSLFNRLLGKRHAVVEEKEGTTRDRIEALLTTGEKDFILTDTGGFLQDKTDAMSILVKNQIEKAITSSDVLLFVCDGISGVMPLDVELGRLLRKSGKKIVLLINKIDNEKISEDLYDFYELGLGEPIGISCLHNKRIGKVLTSLEKIIPTSSMREIEKANPIKIAIVGRPNVGKSSFLNKVLDEERAIVHDMPGTTRDSIDSYFTKDEVLFLLIDTAGIRHKKKVKNAVDIYSMMRARDSIDQAHVVLLVIDGMEGVTKDDTKIFDYIIDKGIGCIIVVNKWDLIKKIETSKYRDAILRKMPQARNFPFAFISAKTGRNALSTFNLVKDIKTNSGVFLEKPVLKRFLKEINPERVRISRRKRLPKFYYMTELRTFPKEFLFFVNDAKRVTPTHTAFIENRLREHFSLMGIPIKIKYETLGEGKGTRR